MTEGRLFYESARSLVGVPWRFRGRSRSGVDCGGLLIVAAKERGLVPADFDRVFAEDDSYDGLHSTLSLFADEIGPEVEPQDGDIWTYSFTGDMHAHCVVACPSEGTVVHAYPAVQRVAEHGATGKWSRRVHRRYRMRFGD